MSEYKCPQCGAAYAAENPWPCPACSYGSELASSGGYAFKRWIPPITHQGESVGSSESSKSMNPHYHFDLMVECPDGTRRRAAFKIDAFEAPFEKYDLCSTPLAAMMAGGVMKMGAARIDSDRKRLAQQIAEQLTKTILDAVQSRDLVNGYPKE